MQLSGHSVARHRMSLSCAIQAPASKDPFPSIPLCQNSHWSSWELCRYQDYEKGPSEQAAPEQFRCGGLVEIMKAGPSPIHPGLCSPERKMTEGLKCSKRRTHLAEGALPQDLEKFELRRISLLGAFLHMVRDVDLLHDAFALKERHTHEQEPLQSRGEGCLAQPRVPTSYLCCVKQPLLRSVPRTRNIGRLSATSLASYKHDSLFLKCLLFGFCSSTEVNLCSTFPESASLVKH